MDAMVFDTPKRARRLEEAGFATAQAEGPAAAIADTFREDLATRRDVKESKTALRHVLKESEARLDNRITATEAAPRADIQALRAEMRAELQAFRTERKAGPRGLQHRMTIRLGSMLVGAMVKLL
ncbi:hypothetical protein ACFQS7_18185 [Dankookia sp. GCM10030260]|uniref:hypothetical protein n=1 Tax=Dankookia sp. GCM10030260 TaxID=3273390 RepID=UPI0036073308